MKMISFSLFRVIEHQWNEIDRGEMKYSGKKPVPVPLFFFVAQQPLVGQGLLIIEASRSHSDTPRSVGRLWTSDQPDGGTSTWQHTMLTRHRQTSMPPAGFEPAIAASERPQNHLDRAATGIGTNIYNTVINPRYYYLLTAIPACQVTAGS
jgi:hypothetical protein